jgi:adenylate cyclase
LAERNEHYASQEKDQMVFRAGVNMGDVIIDGDNLYGEGVNVAARLESIAKPGSVCVSSKIYEEVKRKLDLVFRDGGVQELKNIADPVSVYHVNVGEAEALGERERSGSEGERPSEKKAEEASERPTVAVLPLKVISGDEEIVSLAEGLHEDIIDGLTKQTAIAVVSRLGVDNSASSDLVSADFRLEGSVRAASGRLRLSFALFDAASQSQAWSERYDRQLDNIFDLEDEISESVVSAVRIRIKARAFEKLRDTNNEALSVPDLLSKAAGYFVTSYGHNEEAAETLRLAIERTPENSMAIAMAVFCRHRMFEFSVFDLLEEVKSEVFSDVEKALSLNPSSFFARLIAAMAYQDLKGDYDTALMHAETSLELNSGFSQAMAMVGIAKCHVGETEKGIEMLQRGIAATPDDPHRFRHFRELAIAYFITGQLDQAVSTIDRLARQAPDLLRNQLVLASLLWHKGQKDDAKRHIGNLLRDYPDLNQRNMRPVRFADPQIAERFAQGLTKAGLPE